MKKFRTYQPEQLLLLPQSIDEWLPENHLARFVSDLVDQLDLSEIIDSYDFEKGGQPPYHPLMMTKLLLYAYCTGTMSSRRIERATWEHVPYRVLATNQHPDHHTIGSFRKRHLKALSGLFRQVLGVAQQAGLVKLAHVSVDGTKLAANASIYNTVSYEQLSKREEKLKKHVDELRKRVQEIFEEAERVDAEEDAMYGEARGDELPAILSTKESRLAKIRESLAAMKAAGMDQVPVDEAGDANKPEAEEQGKNPQISKAKEKKRKKGSGGAKSVRNMTDPDSHIMRCAGGNWIQGYNAQAVVDEEAQIIVAAAVTSQSNDIQQLEPMLEKTKAMTGRMPDTATADTGYFNSAQLKSRKLKDVNLLVPPPNIPPMKSENKRGKRMFPASDTMRAKLEKDENKKLYRRRKAIIEPVFGQIKERQFRKFTFRGIHDAEFEWNLVCMTHNMLKLYRAKHVW